MLHSICLETNKAFWLERQRPKKWKNIRTRRPKSMWKSGRSVKQSQSQDFHFLKLSSVSIFNGYGAKPKGMGASAQNMKNIRTRHQKTCEKIGTFFKKRNVECIERERRKQERRLKKEKRRKKRKRVSAAREQILATCNI